MGVPTDYRGNPQVFTASATDHGTSAANATVVATARSRGSFRGELRRTNHENPRNSAETDMAISTAIRGHCHGNAAITTEVCGNCHGCFRGRSFEAISTAIRDRPRPLPRQSSDTRPLPRKSVGVRGYCHSTCRGSVGGKLRRTNRAHGRPGAWPWILPWVLP